MSGSGILFVGNSLTYANELPLLVQAAFDNADGARYEVADVSKPNFGLEDHWVDPDRDARREIGRGGWDIVVMQQGPTSLPRSRIGLRRYAARFATSIRAIGARPAIYCVWPPDSRAQYFDDVIESYALAAADIDALFFPVGEAWRAAWRRDPDVPLYTLDMFHPSPTGSYLAALVMYGVISGRSPVGLPAQWTLRTGRTLDAPQRLVTMLQEAAAEAIAAA